MKTLILIARVLLGVMFVVFGLNGFLNFIPSPPQTGIAAQFLGALFVSHYLGVIFALQLVAGVMLLANRFVPAALAILAPLLVNIALFHVFMAPAGYAPAVMAIALWSLVFIHERAAFAPIFAVKGTP